MNQHGEQPMAMKSHRFDVADYDRAVEAAGERDKDISAAIRRFIREYPAWVASRCQRDQHCLLEAGHKGRCVIP